LWIIVVALALPAQAETIRILGFGDSLMAGYGLAEEEGFPNRLQAALNAKGLDVEIINAGVSGDTTAGGAARLAWSLAENPDAVIVELGGNDGLRGIPPEDTRRNLESILSTLQSQGVPVLFTGMLAPPNMGREYGEAFAQVFADLGAKYDVVYDPFFLEGVAGDLSLNQPDGIHPNAAGVDRIVQRITPLVEALVERARRG
jgi:acyl-CoA thioesterase-1